MTLKIQKIEPTGVVYSDPADPGLTFRFKSSTQNKSLNGVAVANYTTEIIVNDDSDITINDVNAVDALSIRLRVSGTNQSMARVKVLLASLAGGISDWADEDVFIGFNPVTAPQVPFPTE